ncbi:MFS transporter [Streptomyces sp. NPDC058691]|uniref:MFS transporter n=1 Tax=Streptomyces sp. NPDC058691 TaxID=3346601 RepID=UPI0036572500
MYAVLFADSGLSEAGISSLFALWSLTAFALEVPSGVWADRFSRRALLFAAPLLAGAGFALWTYQPGYASFAAGFVLWGAGTALRSGALQALVHEGLTAAGAGGAYARLIGRSQAVGTTAALAATALAGPLLGAGGYRAVGLASIAVTVLTALAALRLPERRGGHGGPAQDEPGDGGLLREALAEARHTPGVAWMLAVVSLLAGAAALDEYVPLLARATGVGASLVPLLVLLVTAGATAGGWLAGRGMRWAPAAPAAAALCLAAGAGTASGHPAGLVAVAVAFGVFDWAGAAADARLQELLGDRTRATVTSLAGLGSEAAALLLFGFWALGSRWAGPAPLFALAGLPFLVAALFLWWRNIPRGPRRQ